MGMDLHLVPPKLAQAWISQDLLRATTSQGHFGAASQLVNGMADLPTISKRYLRQLCVREISDTTKQGVGLKTQMGLFGWALLELRNRFGVWPGTTMVHKCDGQLLKFVAYHEGTVVNFARKHADGTLLMPCDTSAQKLKYIKMSDVEAKWGEDEGETVACILKLHEEWYHYLIRLSMTAENLYERYHIKMDLVLDVIRAPPQSVAAMHCEKSALALHVVRDLEAEHASIGLQILQWILGEKCESVEEGILAWAFAISHGNGFLGPRTTLCGDDTTSVDAMVESLKRDGHGLVLVIPDVDEAMPQAKSPAQSSQAKSD